MQGLVGAGDHFQLECRFIATVNNRNCPEIPFAFLLPLQTSMSPCASRYHSISMQCNRHLSARFSASSSIPSTYVTQFGWTVAVPPLLSLPSSSFCPPAVKETMDDET